MIGRKPFYRRVWFWIPVAIVLFVGILALIATPLARFGTNKALAQVEAFDSEYDSVSFNLFTLTYTLHKLKLSDAVQKPPVVYVEDIVAHVDVKELFRFNIVGNAHVGGAKVTWVLLPRPKPKETAKPPETPDIAQLDEILRSIIPFKVGRVEVTKSELLLVDGSEATRPKIWIKDIEMSLEDFTNRRKLDEGWPATFALSATVQKSGKLTVFVTADPLSDVLKLAGRAELKHLKLADLHAFLAAKTGLSIPEGTFDLYAGFKTEKGYITGVAKPFLRDVNIEAADKKLSHALVAEVADAALDLLSDDNKGRDTVAAELPIKGKLTSPKPEILPTVLSVLRNAFIESLSASFVHTPSVPNN